MKKFNKFLSVAVASAMVMAMAGCGNTDNGSAATGTNAATESASVPAEALLHYIRGKALVFASFSATLFYLDSVENDIKILYMKGLHKECVEQNTYLMYDTLETVQNHLKQIHMEEIPIVEL